MVMIEMTRTIVITTKTIIRAAMKTGISTNVGPKLEVGELAIMKEYNNNDYYTQFYQLHNYPLMSFNS
jgi:hypothetical protein